MDAPGARRSHVLPTPRGGGVGIAAVGLVTFGMLAFRVDHAWMLAGVGLLLVASAGWWDDHRPLPVWPRLLAQLAAGVCLAGALALQGVPLLVAVAAGVLVPVLVNVWNFIDGIDGIAGLSGVIGFGLLGVCSLYRAAPDSFQTPLSLLAICVSLACLGYLPFNLPRARVFMGDVGSILLGFVFACLVVILSRDYLEMVCFAALLFPFYADELTTMAVRLRDHENLTQSHRRHLYQLLANEFGIAHWKISAAYATAQLAIGVGVLIARFFGLPAVLILLTVCFIGFAMLTVHVRKIADRRGR